MSFQSARSSVIFELAEDKDDTYQILNLGTSNEPKVQVDEKPRKKRKLFWWLKGGVGKPKKYDELQTLQHKWNWKRDFAKPLQMLTYPQGPGTCDHNTADRTINLITTLPFFGVAYHTFKHRRSREGKVWGLSLAGVGLGSIAFHTTSGDARPWGRKVDYWAIALSSISLTRCLFPKTRSALTSCALGVSTFNPLAVSTVNAIAMEGKFASRAIKNPELRKQHGIHLATVLLGAAAFVGEEFYPQLPVVHAGWHVASAISVATTNYLLNDLEKSRSQRRQSSRISAPPPSDPLHINTDNV